MDFNRGCSACEGLLSVDPKGNLLPCSSWPEPIGNLLEDVLNLYGIVKDVLDS